MAKDIPRQFRDAVLARMLKPPPKPFTPTAKKKPSPSEHKAKWADEQG